MRGQLIHDVPIFPLNTVLFPSMPLPLQIFEQRYIAMLEDLKSPKGRFCVAHILEGQEVGGSAEPADVACLAEIVHLQALPGERFFLVAVGVERVRIRSTDRMSKPYIRGSVELWPDENTAADPDVVQKAKRLFAQYIQAVKTLTGEEAEEVPLPEEPGLLSYMLATTLQVEVETRQALLEVPGSAERLMREIQILQSELPVLRALMLGPNPPGAGYGQFSAN